MIFQNHDHSWQEIIEYHDGINDYLCGINYYGHGCNEMIWMMNLNQLGGHVIFKAYTIQICSYRCCFVENRLQPFKQL
jgi:hypothetical protein